VIESEAENAVLIVEDDEATAELERRALTRAGLRAVAVSRASEAVALLRQPAFRVVLLDYHLPDGEPWAVLEAARARVPRVPVIIVTAMGNEHVAVEAIHRGVADYVKKADSFLEQLPNVIERVTRLARVEDSNALLAAMVESSDDAIFGIDVEGRIMTWNSGATRVCGHARDEIIGHSVAELFAPRDVGHRALTSALTAGTALRHLDSVWLRKDGREVLVSVTLSPIRDEHERATCASVTARDVTERRQMQAQLTQRMATVGTVAAGIAHEINNPLAYVIMNLQYVADEVRDNPGEWEPERRSIVERSLADALDGGERVRRIVLGLKSFSRADDSRVTALDVSSVLQTAINMAFNEIRHRATVVKDFGASPLVEADESRLLQIFVNLLINAAQSIPEGNASRNEIRIATSTDARGNAVVEVRDTGAGIPEGVRGRIFEPFFTTKPVGTGTGLGLAICRDILTPLGGDIGFESEVGTGTTFRVSLPPARSGIEPGRRKSAPRVTPTRRGRVLVGDDETFVAASLGRILGRDHEVTIAGSGRQILDLIGAGERFDAILCDLMMPETTGMEVYAGLCRTAPDQAERMIFMSGGAFTYQAQAFLDQVPNARLDKPLDSTALREIVRNLVR